MKLGQWQDASFADATEFGVVDHKSEVLSNFEADVHVALVRDTATGETRIDVDGVLAGSTPGNPTMSGVGAVMVAQNGMLDSMSEGSVMYG